MDAENYEKYSEKICKLLKPNSLIIIDNASYHSRNSDDYPKSKWKKAQFEQWLKENKVNFPFDALRSELWVLRETQRNEKNAKVVDIFFYYIFWRYILLLLDTVFQTCYMLRTYMMFYMFVPPPFCFCSPKGTIMKIRSILTCIMLSLPQYLNCKTFRCVYCFL